MTVDELKADLEAAAGAIDALQEAVPTSVWQEAMDVIAAFQGNGFPAALAVLQVIRPGMDEPTLRDILAKASAACSAVKRMEDGGQLDRIKGILRGLQHRSVILAMIARVMGGCNEAEI
jgi:hypothetical protein